MTQENIEKIREGLRQLDEATNGIQGLLVFALVMPHGTRGQMQVQILSKGCDTQVAHKLYECMRHDASLPFSLTNIIMTTERIKYAVADYLFSREVPKPFGTCLAVGNWTVAIEVEEDRST